MRSQALYSIFPPSVMGIDSFLINSHSLRLDTQSKFLSKSLNMEILKRAHAWTTYYAQASHFDSFLWHPHGKNFQNACRPIIHLTDLEVKSRTSYILS